MSASPFKDGIQFLQRILAVSGFYKKSLNGKVDSDVDGAEEAFFAKYKKIKSQYGELDPRTRSCIATYFRADPVNSLKT
jgi:hypothetical protein